MLSRNLPHLSELAARLPVVTVRLAVFFALAATQMAAISFLFYFPTGLAEWVNPVSIAKKVAQFAVLAALTLLLVAWPRRKVLLGAWGASAEEETWGRALLRNLVIFVVLAAATIAFSAHAARSSEPPWMLFFAYCCLLLLNGWSLALIAAPMSFWRQLPRLAPLEIVLAAGGALFVLLAGEFSRTGWETLSSATLKLSAWILSLYESQVYVDEARKLLGVGDFSVIVTAQCSGYEGIGLVVSFLALYLFVFRSDLKFPNALLLLPLGVAIIWLLNAFRIAALVTIGAHLSPAVAIDGFHSQAGWIAFVLVTLGLIVTAHSSSYFRRSQETVRAARSEANTLLYALLMPFIALMASSIIASAFAPNDQWLYALKVIAVGAAVWIFRKVYLVFGTQVSPHSLAVGLAVGVVWIATDPLRGEAAALGAWLAALPPAAAVLWLALRAIGSVVLVPLAEELAFRGYLHRALISRQIENVAPGQFNWLAFVVTSVLFGLIHQRWLAAMLAGAAYAILMYRTGRLSDPIAAHMTSNAAIMFWAIVAGQWSLL